jgi:hypothetical protein
MAEKPQKDDTKSNIRVTRQDLLWLGLTLGIILLLHLPLLYSVLDAKDCVTFSYPHSYLLSRALQDYRLPLWSQALNYPMHAESQGGYAYPLHLLLNAIASPWLAHNLDLLIHLLLAASATYAFIRLKGPRPAFAALGALAYALSSHFAIHIGILPFVQGGAFLPVFFLVVALYHRRGDWRWLIGLAIAFGLALLAGHFQFTTYVMLSALAFLIWGRKAESKSELGKRLLAVVWVPILGMLIAAVQVIPSGELALASARGGLGDLSKMEFSWTPVQGVSFIVPQFFGEATHPSVISQHSGIWDSYFGMGSYFESTYYVGIIPLILAFLSLGLLKSKNDRRRLVGFFWALLGIAFILALGRFNPLYRLLNQLPPFGFFRHPLRLLFLACFGLSVLSAIGGERLLASGMSSRFRNLIILLVPLTILLIATGWLATHFYHEQLGTLLADYFYEGNGGLSASGAMQKAFDYLARMETVWSIDNQRLIWQIAIISLSVAVILLLGKRRSLRQGELLLFIVLLLDLGVFTQGRDFFVPPHALTQTETREQDDHLNMPLTRIYSAGWELSPEESYLSYSLQIPNSSAIDGVYSVLTPRVSLQCEGSATLEQALWQAVFSPGDGSYPLRAYLPSTQLPSPELLQRLGVKYLFKRVPLTQDSEETQPGEADIYLYQFDDAWGRAFILDVAQLDCSDLSGLLADNLAPQGTVQYLQYDDEYIRLSVNGPAGLLVLSELYYPGWLATIDGEKTEIKPVFTALRGIDYPGGEHIVEFVYQPRSFYAGLAVTLISLGLSFFVLLVRLISSRQKNELQSKREK